MFKKKKQSNIMTTKIWTFPILCAMESLFQFRTFLTLQCILYVINPVCLLQDRIPLKFVISYSIKDEMITEMSEVPSLSLKRWNFFGFWIYETSVPRLVYQIPFTDTSEFYIAFIVVFWYYFSLSCGKCPDPRKIIRRFSLIRESHETIPEHTILI